MRETNLQLCVLGSLDEMLGPGAEALFVDARARKLLRGVAVGIVRDGRASVRVYGNGVGLDSVFELGSLTKTYTVELLGRLVEKGVVRLDDPVTCYLPGGSARHKGARPVTLLDLATHFSGEPRLPPGLPLFHSDPYATYSDRMLETYLAGRPLQLPSERKFLYSNLGYGILGYALGRASGLSYAKLLMREILGPAGLTETVLALGQQQRRLLQGYTQAGFRTRPWTFQALAPCGALCATAADQMRYLAWLLEHPQRLALQPQAEIPGGRIGLDGCFAARVAAGTTERHSASAAFSRSIGHQEQAL